LIFFTDVPGVYWDFANQKQLYDTTLAELSAYRQEGVFSAGMIPKVEAMQFAAAVGVPKVYVIDGRDAQSALWAVHDVHADDQKNAKSQRAKREIYGTRLVTQLNSMKE
jgi:acetylglutamate kinase